MDSFNELIKEHRMRLKLKPEEVAAFIGKTHQYVNLLERSSSGNPSTKVLNKLIYLLSHKEISKKQRDKLKNLIIKKQDWRLKDLITDVDLIDFNIFIRLSFTALSAHNMIRYAAGCYDNRSLEVNFLSKRENNEIWVMSDDIFDQLSVNALYIAVDIRKYNCKYIFFIPTEEISNLKWEKAYFELIDALLNKIIEPRVTSSQDAHFIMDSKIEVYQISNIAFNCEMKIINPLDENPVALYLIKGRSSEEQRFIEMQPHLAKRIITKLSLIRHKGVSVDETDTIIDIPELGKVSRVFPKKIFSYEVTMTGKEVIRKRKKRKK